MVRVSLCYATVLPILATILVGGCTQPVQAPSVRYDEPQDQRFVLRVALFPSIPEADSFAAWVERSFETENPDIDLVVRPMDKAKEVDLSYDVHAAETALMDPLSADYQHLIEIDTLILGSLVSSGAIQPFSLERVSYFDFAREAVEIDGRSFGVPHWTCGYFIMSTVDGVVDAETAAELRAVLASRGSPHPDLGGDLIGSWGSVMVYLDAYLDTYPSAHPAEALDHAALDASVAAALAEIGTACTSSGTGLCDREDVTIKKDFGSGRLDALIGFSEQLNAVFADAENQLAPREVRIGSAPLGVGRTNLLLTDALVQSSTCSSPRCRDAARRFAEFYVSDATMAGSMLSEDLGATAIPRYLLPATSSVMTDAVVAQDPIYRQLVPILASARPYPNRGIPEARERGTIGAAVNALLHPSQ